MGKYYTTTIQKGSQGDDVKEWQTFLNSQGYNLSVDGDFGDNTLAATTDWQTKNGIGADGIVGEKTWGKAGYTNYSTISTPTAAPNINTTPTAAPNINTTATALPTTDTTKWDDTTKGSAALGAYNDAKGAVTGYKDFTFSQNDWLTQVLSDIKGYGDFSYDINGDALYQQYKDKYIQQGKLAMADTIGQASAMTGGYGNSYAQSAGQQAYQGQLDNLNDIVPELYQMALDRYNMGKEDLYNQYGLLQSEYEKEYGLHQDEYNKLLDALGIAQGDYYNGADMYHTEQSTKNNELWKQWEANESVRKDSNDELWKQAEWEETLRQDSNDELWKQAEWDESIRQYQNSDYWKQKEYDAMYGNDSSGSSGTPNKGTTPSGVAYDNGSVEKGNIQKMQEALGIGVDGYWGPKSTEAAGGLSADEAWAAYQRGELGQKPTIQPKQTDNTTKFIATSATQYEYVGRNKTLAQFQAYIKDKIDKATHLSDEEVAYLIRHYGLE